MTVKHITNIIEKFAPLSLQIKNDNCGLLVGYENANVSGIIITLDVTLDTINEAIREGCNLIISHHPFIFNGLTEINHDTVRGKMIYEAIKHNINIYSAHTNVDACKGGLNDHLASLFGLKNVKPYTECEIGRVGTLAKPITLADLAVIAKNNFDEEVKIIGDPQKEIKTLVVSGGSCPDDTMLYKALYIHKADCIITSDIRHHASLWVRESGFSAVIASHFATEISFCEIIKQLLQKEFQNKNSQTNKSQDQTKTLNIIISKTQKAPQLNVK
ncbi:MAG: Nif3-like dinuclear metal center hexameric protein [Firmicutes bacterium]|nr:Nif3-like dinuclear metal center hexameric protein [Bacillota bacterium]